MNLAACGRTFPTGLTRFFSIFILNILSILSKKWKFRYFQVTGAFSAPQFDPGTALCRAAHAGLRFWGYSGRCRQWGWYLKKIAFLGVMDYNEMH
jgi:hypothetical protein